MSTLTPIDSEVLLSGANTDVDMEQASSWVLSSLSRSAFSSGSNRHDPTSNVKADVAVTEFETTVANPSTMKKVWLITGASSGLGYSIAVEALSRGDAVIATARNVSKLEPLKDIGAYTMQLDVTDDFGIIREIAEKAIQVYGRVDVLVNNAGYTLFGALEEVGAEGYLNQYKTNVFGVINVTNAFLPHMRQRRSGSIVIVGSRSAWTAKIPLYGPYSSSKAAVHAIAESLTEELKPFNIKVLLVQPGAFRTNLMPNSELKSVAQLQNTDYETFYTIGSKMISNLHGTQPGDPKKAGRVIVDIVRGEGCAVGRKYLDTIILGGDAAKDVKHKCESIVEILDDIEWKDVSRGVSF